MVLHPSRGLFAPLVADGLVTQLEPPERLLSDGSGSSADRQFDKLPTQSKLA